MKKAPLLNLSILDIEQNDDETISIRIDIPDEFKHWFNKLQNLKKWSSTPKSKKDALSFGIDRLHRLIKETDKNEPD